ncbi:MAG TPA: SurA N-terminal domain-containing protein [Syntrophales bacterium]|nr:SurA N-terminal domain-containing protein [Syntrophales bacterium]
MDKSGARRPVSFWLFSIFFSAILLVLAGILLWYGHIGAWDLSWDRLIGRPAAMVNGEAISREDLRVRVKTSRRILELQYGNDIFNGKEGKNRLVALQKEILDRMAEERLIAQEARRLGIRIGAEQVDRELRRIAGEIYGSMENFQKGLTADGLSGEGLKNHIRHILTTREVIKIKSLPDKGILPEVSFAAWLAQLKKTAKVVVYNSSIPVAGTSSGSLGCCGSGGSSSGCGGKGGSGGCGSQGSAGPVDAKTEQKAKETALAAYKEIDGDTERLKIRVSDYGCHIQVDVYKDGKTVKSYSYRDGRVFEI